MKKALILILALVMLFAMFSCGKDDNTDESVSFDYEAALTETGVDLDIGSVIIE